MPERFAWTKYQPCTGSGHPVAWFYFISCGPFYTKTKNIDFNRPLHGWVLIGLTHFFIICKVILKVVHRFTTFSFFRPICRSLILHDRRKYDILQTIYGKAAVAENGRAAKLGPMDAPFRGQNALRGMFEAGWLLVSGRKCSVLSTSSILPLHIRPDSLCCGFDEYNII